MVLPRLIHPIPTYIQSALPSEAVQDELYREPYQSVLGVSYSETFTVNGQWKWFSDRQLSQQRYGSEEKSDGYIIFRYIDLNAVGKTLNRGDRIIGCGSGISRQTLDVYIIKLRPEGHYQDRGGPTLLKAYFSDRQPSRQSPGV